MHNIESGAVLFSYISALSVVIPILYYLARRKRTSGEIELVFTLLCTSLVSEVTNEFFVRIYAAGQVVLNLNFAVQFSLLSWMYAKLFRTDGGTAIKVTAISFFMVCAVVTTFIQEIVEFQSLVWSIGSIIMIAYSFCFYIRLYRSLPVFNIKKAPLFWINSAVFFYYSLSVWIFAISSYAFTMLPTEAGALLWSFHNFNNIVRNLLFTAAFYMSFEPPPQQSHDRPQSWFD